MPGHQTREGIVEDPVLLIIDVQRGLDDPGYGHRNNPDAETNMARLLAAWRTAGRQVVHVQHLSVRPDSPLRPGQPGCDLKPEVTPAPGEPHFTKTVNSAFIGTGLEAWLREHGHRSVVVVGLTTDHCVSTTVRMAANLGFDVTLVSDATATFERMAPDGIHLPADVMHRANLASLDGEFCSVLTTSQVLGTLA
jgi:nicotinamidase-related amidase